MTFVFFSEAFDLTEEYISFRKKMEIINYFQNQELIPEYDEVDTSSNSKRETQSHTKHTNSLLNSDKNHSNTNNCIDDENLCSLFSLETQINDS
jgi:hypothetical protein